MSDRVNFKVSVTPIETLTAEQTPDGDTDIIASEVGKVLSGEGDSVTIANYGNAADGQGYLNATVNYHDAVHTAGGVQIGGGERDVWFIKNTGYKYSSATALGAATTDCVMVVLRTAGYVNATQSGWYTAGDVSEPHFFEVAWLKPGQAIVLPAGATNVGITNSKFGSNNNDLSVLGNLTSAQTDGESRVYVRTFQSNGDDATDGNAVEYLCVT